MSADSARKIVAKKAHKYAVGQVVRFSPGVHSPAALKGNYKVVRLLPAEANDHQYRIQSTVDGHERVVRESQLT